MSCQSFLFLQGVATPFFAKLEKALTNEGHTVHRINFCGGDWLFRKHFSHKSQYIDFQGKPETLPAFYEQIISQYKITDLILFGDTRPLHHSAIELGKARKLNIHVFEEGYFRPNWVTLDKNGVNANSSLSKNPEWFLDYVKQNPAVLKTPKENKTSAVSLSVRAWHDIRYHLANLFLKPKYPHYVTHRPENASKEYWGWIQRMPALKFYFNAKSERQISELLANQKPFYVLPLQLDADSQIKVHSPIKSVTEVILTTLKSFATYAPQDAILVIKLHPFDPWFIDYPAVIRETAKAYDINENRLLYLEAGNLVPLLNKTHGTVVVNSTVGTLALAHNSPVIALGSAIYDMQGLTFQGDLDDFWRSASPPDTVLFNAFRATLIELTQINGNFYNEVGMNMAVENTLKHFLQNQE
ncbi:MAG: capsular biosynthesis protein [Cocleimonas sp.]